MITLDPGQESMHLEHVIMPNARTYPKIIETYYTKGPCTSPTKFLSNCVTIFSALCLCLKSLDSLDSNPFETFCDLQLYVDITIVDA